MQKLIIMLLVIPMGIQAQNLEDPVEYNNIIILEQSHIITETLDYIQFSANSDNLKEIEKSRNSLINEIRNSITKIKSLPPFEGSNRLKNETINVFNIYLDTYQNDLLTALSLKKKYSDSYAALQAYFEAEKIADDKLNDAVQKLTKAQERFAKKHKLAIDRRAKSESVKKMEGISELKLYSRSVFEEYFKVSYEFNELIKAIDDRKAKLLNRKREKVIDEANKSLRELRRKKPFNGNREYVSLAIDIIEYFKDLSQNEFKRIVDLFEKDALTQKDADFINKVFNDYNANIELLVYNWNYANHKLWKENL